MHPATSARAWGLPYQDVAVSGSPGGQNGHGGPEQAARLWIRAVMQEDDWDTAWALTDEVFRLAQVQAWLWPHRHDLELAGDDLDELAGSLCREGPEHALWEEFADMVLQTYRDTWLEFDLRRWSVAGRPRLVAPDLEVVVFTRREDPVIQTEQAVYVARPFLMRFDGGAWAVAHAGSDQLPVPGWPPEFPAASAPE